MTLRKSKEEIFSNFNIKSVKKGLFDIIVTTETTDNSIPPIVNLQVDVINRTVIIDGKKFATYMALEKVESKKRKYSRKSRSSVPIYDSSVKILKSGAKFVCNLGNSTLNWMSWIVKSILSTIYTELLDFGPLSLPIWGFILCLIPGIYPYVETVTLNVTAWTLQVDHSAATIIQEISDATIIQKILKVISSTMIFLEESFGYKITIFPKILPQKLTDIMVNSYNHVLNVSSLLSSNNSAFISTLLKTTENQFEIYILSNLIKWFTNPIMYSSSKYIIQAI